METLVQYNAMRQALIKTHAIDEVKDIRDRAEALRQYAKQAGESLESQNMIAEIKLRAERRAGELLGEMEKALPSGANQYRQDVPHDVTRPSTLSDLGITRMQSSRWQSIAQIPEQVFEKHLIETRESKEELTSASVLKIAKEIKQESKEREREAYVAPPAPASPTLLVGDIDTLSMFDDNSIDIIITSPPYNLGDETWPMGGDGRQERDGIGYQSHNDNMSQAEYETWQIHVFKELWRIAKPGASFFYNHKTRTEKGRLIHPMRWVGDDRNPWLVRQEIIWNRLSTHNHSASLFWPIDERIYWMTKGPPSLTEPIGMSTIWEKFGPVPNTWHPAPFTVELPRMLLKAVNAGPGQIVLDPFVGSCSTMHAALERGCEAVGIDICEEYLERAVKESGWVWTTD